MKNCQDYNIIIIRCFWRISLSINIFVICWSIIQLHSLVIQAVNYTYKYIHILYTYYIYNYAYTCLFKYTQEWVCYLVITNCALPFHPLPTLAIKRNFFWGNSVGVLFNLFLIAPKLFLITC